MAQPAIGAIKALYIVPGTVDASCVAIWGFAETEAGSSHCATLVPPTAETISPTAIFDPNLLCNSLPKKKPRQERLPIFALFVHCFHTWFVVVPFAFALLWRIV